MKYATFALCCLLSACGVVSEQSFYEGIRTNERAKSVGTGQSDKALPHYDRYSQERETLKK
jgi:mannitol/fructose-specific phosphotransferase system IIA component (Ntr-type)